MEKRFGKIFFAIGVILIIIILLMLEQNSQNLAFIKDFSITDVEEKQVYGLPATQTSAIRSDQTIKILHLKGSDLKKTRLFLDEKKFGVESLYNSQPSPYPDVITREIVCPQEYLPIVEEDEDENFYKIIYTLFANERFSYGACSPEIITYKSVFSLIHCKNSGDLYQIEFFSPLESYDEEILNGIKDFSC